MRALFVPPHPTPGLGFCRCVRFLRSLPHSCGHLPRRGARHLPRDVGGEPRRVERKERATTPRVEGMEGGTPQLRLPKVARERGESAGILGSGASVGCDARAQLTRRAQSCCAPLKAALYQRLTRGAIHLCPPSPPAL